MLYSVFDIFPDEMSFRLQSCAGKYFHFTRVSSGRYQELRVHSKNAVEIVIQTMLHYVL